MKKTLFEKESKLLKEKDELLGKVIDSVKEISFEWNEKDYFYSLCMNIAYQQLAGSAAKAIWNRVKERTKITPEGMLKTDLNGTGLSRMKISYMKEQFPGFRCYKSPFRLLNDRFICIVNSLSINL